MPLQRGAGAERNDRNLMRRADLDNVCNLCRFLGKNDCIRGLICNPGRCVAVLFAYGLSRVEPFVKTLFQNAQRRADTLFVAR